MRNRAWQRIATRALAALCVVGSGQGVFGQQIVLSNESEEVQAAEQQTPADKGEEYWLGVSCAELTEDLRADLELGEARGLVVRDVVPESPAGKAKLQRDDVLVAAGDEQLRTPRDLMRVVRKAKDSEIKLQVVRGGEPQEIVIRPEKRRVNPSEVFGHDAGPFNVRIFRPGHVLPPRLALQLQPRNLPDDMTVTISKHGKELAKIRVEQGDEKWEVTEDKLDELPENVRPHVEPMLGRLAIKLPATVGDVLTYTSDPEQIRARVDEAREAARAAARDAERTARQAGREADDAARQAEDQARDVARQARQKAIEVRRQAEKSARDAADEAIDRGRVWVDKQLDEKFDMLEQRIDELRSMLDSLRSESKKPAPDRDEAEQP